MSNNYEKYLSTWSGQELLKRHKLNQEGVWRIRGEDPNCDFGGLHHMPELDLVEGKLEDVIHYGVNLSNFWAWGGGGDFTLITPSRKIDDISNKVRAEKLIKLGNLEREVKALRKELGV